MLRVIPMRKSVAHDRVSQTAGMPRSGKCDESLLPAGGLVDGRLHGSTLLCFTCWPRNDRRLCGAYRLLPSTFLTLRASTSTPSKHRTLIAAIFSPVLGCVPIAND